MGADDPPENQETEYTHQMAVGSLLAYGLGKQDEYRPCTASVIIGFDRLAKYAEPGKPEVMHALSISDPTPGWNFLFPPL